MIPFFCLMFTACASGGKATSMEAFYDVQVGSSREQVISSLGDPVAIHRHEDGSVEYEYVERLRAGSRDLSERRYLILIKDGKVVSKKVKQSSPLPYDYNSYDMQTTQK